MTMAYCSLVFRFPSAWLTLTEMLMLKVSFLLGFILNQVVHNGQGFLLC
jgi:hypothetical protein